MRQAFQNLLKVVRSRPGSHALRWTITIGLLAIVATQVDFRQLGSVLSSVHWGMLGLAAVAVLVDRVLATWRWWMLLRVKGVDIGFWSLLNLHLAASFVGGFLPTSFGVDAARIIMLSRRTGNTMHIVAASAVDRATMIAVTMIAALAASVFLVSARVEPQLQWVLAVMIGACVVGAILLYLAYASRFTRTAVKRITGERVSRSLGIFWISVNEYRRHPMLLAQSTLIGVGMVVVRTVVLVWIAAALAVHVRLIDALGLWPIAAVILMLPVSVGNFGLQEGTYVALFGLLGISATMAVSISLLDHVLSRVVILPGALVWLLSGAPVTREAADHAIESVE